MFSKKKTIPESWVNIIFKHKTIWSTNIVLLPNHFLPFEFLFPTIIPLFPPRFWNSQPSAFWKGLFWIMWVSPSGITSFSHMPWGALFCTGTQECSRHWYPHVSPAWGNKILSRVVMWGAVQDFLVKLLYVFFWGGEGPYITLLCQPGGNKRLLPLAF